ncbi:G protein-coupled receptor rhodopsin-like [Trinorchestia longiramus]|nr:G protein-coupled receptor rhodopsin-like [Trinorchestia longiramus]
MYGMTARLFTQIFYALTFLVGLSGNTLVIYVVARFSKMQTVTNFYILNLALADELFLMGIPFFITTQAYEDWPFGDLMCKMFMTTTSLNQFTSALFLTIMSADRYIAVCQPINSTKFRTPLISKIVSLSAWTVSALMITPMVMYANTLELDGEINCNVFFPTVFEISGHVIFTLYSFILSFGIPFSLIFIFYVLVIHKLQTVGPKSKSKEKKKSHRKVTKLVLTVILVYAVCWLPYWVLQLTLISGQARAGRSPYQVFTFVFCNCLTYINSAINPILYAFLSENFKKSFIKAFACVKSQDGAHTLNAENSAQPRKQKDGLSSRSALCMTDAITGDRRSSHVPSSRDVSSAMTLSSRVPHSHCSEENKNGHLLEVPHTVHAPPRSVT